MNDYADSRWQCPNCGRFVASESVQGEDHRDPDAYAELSGQYGDFKWPSDAARAALKWAAAARR